MTVSIGLIGLGEAGRAIAEGLRGEDVAVRGYDVRVRTTQPSESGSARLESYRATVWLSWPCMHRVDRVDPRELRRDSRPGAGSIAHRSAYQHRLELQPELKWGVAEMVSATGAQFVDGAFMAAVPPARHRVPVLLSGPGAGAIATAVEGIGFNLEVLGNEPRQASARLQWLVDLELDRLATLPTDYVQIVELIGKALAR